VSSPKPEAKMSVEQQVKAGLRAVRDFLAGRSGTTEVAPTEDKATREVVAAELLAKMSGREIEKSTSGTAQTATHNTQETRHDNKGVVEQTKQGEDFQNLSEVEQERERARQLYLEHGYFDEAVQALRAGNSRAQRVAAARALGLAGSQRGTAHLIAAMFDDDPEVRSAAEEAITQIGESKGQHVEAGTVSNRESHAEGVAESTSVNVAKRDWEDERAPWEDVVASAKSELARYAEPDMHRQQVKTPDQDDSPTPVIPTAAVVTNPLSTDEEEQLLLEENRLKKAAEQLSLQLIETANARKRFEQEVQSRIEREAALRGAAAARRSEEEKLRQEADEEAERRRTADREAFSVEQSARTRAETEGQRLVEEETRLRRQAVDLRLSIAELSRQRTASEMARREAAEAAREAEAKLACEQAKSHHEVELARLHSEEEALRAKSDEIATRRAEVAAGRERADREAEQLVEAQARMQASAEAAAQAEVERARLEGEINQRLQTARQLLQEIRQWEQDEEERLQEETRLRAAEQQHHLAELELMKTAAEAESRQLAEQEQQILSHINRLQIADADARKRIEDADAKRRAAEAAYRLVAEKVQRVEAEAHARAKEEEQMLAKLEAERRRVATDAQSRSAQEKRIREEIEMFHRLEEQERPRLEAAILQRTEAEARLQQLRQRLKGEVEDRVSAEEQLAGQNKSLAAAQGSATHWQNQRPEGLSRTVAAGASVTREHVSSGLADVSRGNASSLDDLDNNDDTDRLTATTVTPSIFTYLNSVDPYKRAAAVAELARSRSEDAFGLIANCFDDPSPHVRNAAARALRKLEPDRTVDLFNRALEEASDQRRRNIGAAIAGSGLASEAINNLVSENREQTYNALSILFVMAKTGEVEPLERARDEHPHDEIGKAVAKLLTLSGHSSQ
jgi:hypothetical protein